MTHISTYSMPFKRRLSQKTNYRKRISLLKGSAPRAVIRKSSNSTIVQIVEFDPVGDKTVVSFKSMDLAKLGWTMHMGNLSAAYLTGLAAGMKAKGRGVNRAVLDIGLLTPVHKSRVFAALKGLVDAGIEVPHDAGIFPEAQRIKGAHLKENAVTLFDKVKSEIEKKFGENK
ncbi:MAG: 50S ribosomal protein L18 [archaeon]